MAVKLAETTQADGDQLFFDSDFKNALEYMIPSIVDRGGNSVITIDRAENFAAKYDFYRILAKKMPTLPRAYWWITMRVNGIASPEQYQGDMDSIIIPALDYLNQLATSYRTIRPVR